ncbi:MAG: S8 family serine peptidase [Bacteroidota bacterium]
MNKSHLFFRNPSEGVIPYRSRKGGFSEEDEDEKVIEKPDYTLLANSFRNCITRFENDLDHRNKSRNITIDNHFDLIELTFQGSFMQEKFQAHYIQIFGLIPVRFSLFNRKGLFAIENRTKFDFFFLQLDNFISRYIEGTNDNFDRKIIYIKSFKLFSSNDMYGNIDNFEVIHLSFLGGHTFIEDTHIRPQKKELENYLQVNNIRYSFNERDGEVYDINNTILRIILNNFDFIYATCSGSGAIIQPSIHNTPKRTFDFEITNADETLPIIGIIDSGISNQTPLASIIIGEDDEFNSTSTSSFSDIADHGTGVAAFAAFGTKLIPNYRGEVEADAKVLPIKIIDNQTGAISQQKTIELIRRAHNDYNVRIFTLTIGYTKFPLKDNEEYSSYARMLDELSAELDVLIFISTTNNDSSINAQSDYPNKFVEEIANIAPPAESMNNITIGATANNFEVNDHRGLAIDKDFPAIYSRKFHYNYSDEDAFNQSTRNKYLKKPDIILGGGDYSEYNSYGFNGYFDNGSACIEVLSSDLSERTFRKLGTSYSTPIVANLAARLLNQYPNLSMQTIKALLINSSNEIKTGDIFNDFDNIFKNRIFGHGTPNIESLLNSTDDKVTLIIEDKIIPGNIITFPIHIPKYLNDAQRINGVLKISSTLSFKFKPKLDNQLLYCPIHLTFAIGKNLELEASHLEDKVDVDTGEITGEKTVEDGYNGNSTKKINLNTSPDGGWVQDFYFMNKIVSNVQKTSINVSRANIINEDNTFKIAINSALHKQLTSVEKISYEGVSIPYSLVITIEQVAKQKETFASLYDELRAINTLEIINEVELEAELDN